MCGTGGGLTTFNVSSANAILDRLGRCPGGQARQPVDLGLLRQRRRARGARHQRELPPHRASQLIEEIGISFLYAPSFHPLMMKVFFPELALGIKTIFFTIIGPLINPAGAPHHLMGVYQPHLVELVGDAVTQLDMNHVIVRARRLDGLDEISILGPTASPRSRVAR